MALRAVVDGLLDILYPPRCLICEAWDSPSICSACEQGFLPIPVPFCQICGHPDDPAGAPCRVCAAAHAAWGGWALTQIRAAAVYMGPVRHGIHRLKYDRVAALAEPLGALLANRMVADGLLTESPDVIVPVPLARARALKRGFNQAELLAVPLADALNVPLLPKAVRREKVAEAQVRLSPDLRRRSVQAGAFPVPDPTIFAGKQVLLVDDVFTTGATLNALAQCLLASGATRVSACALAAGG
ncbi:MAG: ComF family protein [Armatimonas sp.]